MSLKVDFKGFDEVEKALKKFPARIVKKALGRAIKKGSKPILTEARRKVPVRTGNLKKSLAIRNIPKREVGNRTIVEVYARSGLKFKHDGWYAHLVEYGTSTHEVSAPGKRNPTSFVLASNFTGSGAYVFFGKEITIPDIPHHPFLRPALSTQAQRVISISGISLAAEIERLSFK